MAETPFELDRRARDPSLRLEAQRDRYERFLWEIMGRGCRHPELGLLCPCSRCLARIALNQPPPRRTP